ncbi:DNA repair endonuclease XPF [Pelomyxa schiedti]|nr:DNA repair endonuclease XPF [Pelomyxa schiedti]
MCCDSGDFGTRNASTTSSSAYSLQTDVEGEGEDDWGNCLLVVGRGLRCDRVVASFLRICADQHSAIHRRPSVSMTSASGASSSPIIPADVVVGQTTPPTASALATPQQNATSSSPVLGDSPLLPIADSMTGRGLVFVLGVKKYEQLFLVEDCARAAAYPLPGVLDYLPNERSGKTLLPVIVDSETSPAERATMYSHGGVFIVSNRILIVDLLSKKLPTNWVTGFVVLNAERIATDSSEAFILRYYRQHNKVGFISAFSEAANTLRGGFAKVEKLMRLLFVKKLYLWPRFRVEVQSDLDSHTPQVFNINIPLTESMKKIQTSLLGVIKACIKELAQSHHLDDETNVENTLFAGFTQHLHAQLDTMWGKLSSKAKQLLGDLIALHKLLTHHLLHSNCVDFLDYLETLRTTQFSAESGWVFLEQANTLFAEARKRVYLKNSAAEVVEVLEENPKWEILKQVLTEIIQTSTGTQNTSQQGCILVLVNDERTCYSLQKCLHLGAKGYLQEAYKHYLHNKENRSSLVKTPNLQYQDKWYKHKPKPAKTVKTAKQNSKELSSGSAKKTPSKRPPASKVKKTPASKKPAGKRRRKSDPLTIPPQTGRAIEVITSTSTNTTATTSMSTHSSPLATHIPADTSTSTSPTAQTSLKALKSDSAPVGNDLDYVWNFSSEFGIVTPPYVLIHPMWECGRLLDELKPNYIVLYDPDVSLVRQIEIFKAENVGTPVSVYFMCYEDSVEKQKYMTSLKKEAESFEALIKEKATMIIPADRDGCSTIAVDDPAIARIVQPPQYNQRHGGKLLITPSSDRKVIVDLREFRSSLPSMLHARGMTVIPAHLEVGDYILSPSLCVERKSLSDLIGSFKSGRLYTQVESMCRMYTNPLLLIEWSTSEEFRLQAEDKSDTVQPTSVTSKLTVLTMHFPKLRLIWSQNPQISAEIFDSMKDGQPEPDLAGIKTSESAEVEGGVTFEAREFLSRLPFVREKNVQVLLAPATGNTDNTTPTSTNNDLSLLKICNMSPQELEQLLLIGPTAASQLHEFIHHSL